MGSLKFLWSNQHIQHVGEDQDRNNEQESEHDWQRLNLLKPFDGCVEKGKAAESGKEQKQRRTHKFE